VNDFIHTKAVIQNRSHRNMEDKVIEYLFFSLFHIDRDLI